MVKREDFLEARREMMAKARARQVGRKGPEAVDAATPDASANKKMEEVPMIAPVASPKVRRRTHALSVGIS